ncbi:hypothetical protein HPB48_007930 [Haemaphysalis longicornis]|uniref:Uncharacterized protein n=1 Tax=Haemaphysalis longicornis TaxID=44386 RepID=A0A9J6H3T5_HAELO|nr:hypothetical protein HPB48_007930 [Haemaphysalis longicornis]
MKASGASARKRGRKIKIQPTSVAKHHPVVKRGVGSVSDGHPDKSSASKKAKWPHALHPSIRDEVPHAKVHGAGH